MLSSPTIGAAIQLAIGSFGFAAPSQIAEQSLMVAPGLREIKERFRMKAHRAFAKGTRDNFHLQRHTTVRVDASGSASLSFWVSFNLEVQSADVVVILWKVEQFGKSSHGQVRRRAQT